MSTSKNLLSEKKVNRIGWIDMAKGYGMLCVIFAHLGVGILGTWIYSFHMPLFFLLSGFVFSNKYDFKTFIKKKCKSILIPYFSLGFIMVIFQVLYNSIHSGSFDVSLLFSLLHSLCIQRRFWTLWYIACLFFLNIIFYLLVKRIKSLKKLFLVVASMFVLGLLYYHIGGVPLPWNIDVVLTSSIFFYGGYWFKSYYPQIRSLFDIKKSVLAFFLFGFINVVFGFWGIKVAGCGLEMYGSTYGFPPFTILSALSGIICIVIFSHWFTVPYIQYIGRNSMLYYAWHQSIMIPLIRDGINYLGYSLSSLSSNYVLFLGERFLELLAIVIILTVCHMIISNSRLKFILGQ